MTPTPASSLGVRDAADVTPAADQSRGSVEGSGRRELPPGVTVALRFSRYRDFSFWLASNVPAVMFPSRGRAERAAIRAAEGGDCVRRQREREEFDQAMEAAALDHQRAAQEAERDRRDAREAAARGKILCATCGCWTDPLEERCWSCEQPPGLGDGLVEPPFARLYELSVEALRERREAAGG